MTASVCDDISSQSMTDAACQLTKQYADRRKFVLTKAPVAVNLSTCEHWEEFLVHTFLKVVNMNLFRGLVQSFIIPDGIDSTQLVRKNIML